MSTSHVEPDSETEYTVRQTGQPFTKDHRIYIGSGSKKLISAWHHVPLYVDKTNGIVNMVVVTPRWSNIRMEVSGSSDADADVNADVNAAGDACSIGRLRETNSSRLLDNA